MDDDTRIAGYKTVKNWKNLRNKIRNDQSNSDLWNEAFDFFQERLDTRYFKPIADIKNNDKYEGEGFSIVAILCSLIEFLETTWTGEIYRYCKDKELQQFEYNKSKQKFISFLENRPPFDSIFNRTSGLAQEFYEEVRCGLLHEASTKSNWIIGVYNESEFYELKDGEKVVDRNIFEQKIKEHLILYKNQLMNQTSLQEAFIRKMNSIAGLAINF